MKKIVYFFSIVVIGIFIIQTTFAITTPQPDWIEPTWECEDDCNARCSASITYNSCMTWCEDNNYYHGCTCPEGMIKHPDSGNCIYMDDTGCQSAFGEGAIWDGNEVDGCICHPYATWNGSQCLWPTCPSGQIFNSSSNNCIYGSDEACQQAFGPGAIFDGNPTDGCTCDPYATWDGSQCIFTSNTCPYEGQIPHPDTGNCIWSSDLYCQNAYGAAYYDGNPDTGCTCNADAIWDGSQCIISGCFIDTLYHKYETAICYVKEKGIVQGYGDGTYMPDNYINRAEFTKIIIASIYDINSIYGNYCFDDIGIEWYAPYVCTAFDSGIIGGYSDGTFRPDNLINLAEALKIIIKAYNITTYPTTAAWYEEYFTAAYSLGILSTINTDPSHLLTRGEMAELIYRIDNALQL